VTVAWRTGSWRIRGRQGRGWWARDWRPGVNFGHQLNRIPSSPVPAPLYSLGTLARIERLRSWCRDGRLGQHSQMADATLIYVHP
jgi:hypothetical protein